MKVGSATIIKRYFGYRAGDGMKEFAAELRNLSAEEKQELCLLAIADDSSLCLNNGDDEYEHSK